MIKKLAILIATLTMVLCCTTTAFAAGETGSITIENAEAGKKYAAYKIFDAAGTSDNMNYAYTIDKDSEWYSIVESYKNDTETNHGLTLEQKEGTETYLVTFDNNFKPADFAKFLKDHMVSQTPTKEITASTGNNKITELPLGYYFVTSEVGTLCNLTTTNKDVTIYDKNVGPTIEKEQNTTKDPVSVEVGSVIDYEIKGTVPSTVGYDDYTYKITDKMSEGLTFNKNVTVSIGGVDITEEIRSNIKYKPDSGENDFEVTIPVKDKAVGAAISIKYTATVNKNAVTNGTETNTATLTFSNNPQGGTDSTPSNPTKVFTGKIEVKKVDDSNPGNPLAGAEFVLYKKVDTTTVKYYHVDKTTGEVTWVDTKEEATKLTTEVDGVITFEGLKNGEYWLKETKAPKGYNILTSDVQITINGSADNLASLKETKTVTNKKGTLLPETGGMGTIGLTALAVAVVACALFLPKKKNRA